MRAKQFLNRVLGGVLIVSVCSGCTTAARQGTALKMGDMNLNELKRHEYQIMDSVEGVGKTKTVLGITFPLFHKQAGFNVHYDKGVAYGVIDKFGGSKAANERAMYDALSKVPNADTVFTMSKTLEQRGFPFIFRVNTSTVKGRGIKIKSDEELDRGRHSGRSITITSEGDLEFEVED